MVKACSSPRTAHALAAKVEVGRKSLAARRAGSIPASGTNKEAVPHQRGGFFWNYPTRIDLACRSHACDAGSSCRPSAQPAGVGWRATAWMDRLRTRIRRPAAIDQLSERRSGRPERWRSQGNWLALRLIGPVRVVVGIDRIFLRWLRRIRIFL